MDLLTSLDQLALRTVRVQISTFAASAVLDERVLQALRFQDGFTPKETELWDYKREAGLDAVGRGKTVKQILSFYNTYGGYIIYGVEDSTSSRPYQAVGIGTASFNNQQLKDAIESYTGELVDISYIELTPDEWNGQLTFGLLHIPKRPPTVSPIYFGKNGPDNSSGRPVFIRERAYFRRLDECVPAETKQDYRMIYGAREDPCSWDTAIPSSLRPNTTSLVAHTLPEKALICNDFVGRDDLIRDLWRWLSDEFAYVKLLVGDGGKGKTSTAYEFCRDVCAARPFGLEKVVWLSAKASRFEPYDDRFEELHSAVFSDSATLLTAIAGEVAILSSDLDGASLALQKKTIKKALETFRCLIVVDDIDSAEPEEQREILALCLQLASQSTRMLLTTRSNVGISRDMSLLVGGLEGTEFLEFVKRICRQLRLEHPTARQLTRLHEVTDGSPMFTESLFRLCRSGMSLNVAIRQWRGKLGSEARNAALKKEVYQLSREARRVLLATAIAGSVSEAELRQITSHTSELLQKCLSELEAQFLLAAPRFIKLERRYAVTQNTRTLVFDNVSDLVADAASVERSVSTVLKRKSNRSKTMPIVGAAINQAFALVKEGRAAEAVETIDVVLKTHRENIDLRSVRATCLLAKARNEPLGKTLELARLEFSRCYSDGQRNLALYEYWYEAEVLAGDWAGAVEVAGMALKDNIPDDCGWRRRRASAYLELGQAHEAAANADMAIECLEGAASDVAEASRRTSTAERRSLIELLWQAHDRGWVLIARRHPGSRRAFDYLQGCVRRSDHRIVVVLRTIETVDGLADSVATSTHNTASQANLLGHTVKVADAIVRRTLNRLHGDEAERLSEMWRAVYARAERVVTAIDSSERAPDMARHR